jgi:hypothetical protein
LVIAVQGRDAKRIKPAAQRDALAPELRDRFGHLQARDPARERASIAAAEERRDLSTDTGLKICGHRHGLAP